MRSARRGDRPLAVAEGRCVRQACSCRTDLDRRLALAASCPSSSGASPPLRRERQRAAPSPMCATARRSGLLLLGGATTGRTIAFRLGCGGCRWVRSGALPTASHPRIAAAGCPRGMSTIPAPRRRLVPLGLRWTLQECCPATGPARLRSPSQVAAEPLEPQHRPDARVVA